MVIEITPTFSIDESELQFDFVRASGPGGQNVNKVSTAVQLRWNVNANPNLPLDAKERLLRLAGSRATADGVLIIEARRYRTQEQNRFDAIQRLTALVQEALVLPKTRKSTRPTITAKAARLSSKKHRGEIKRTRRYIPEEWE